jgi:8-oxo-dGTP pyrophosphatase MutT (NUDIX family)
VNAPEPRTAATVVLVRDAETGPEVLLLRRSTALVFAGGVWAFPGGSLDPEDWEAAGSDEERAARLGAAREAMEEAAVEVDPDTMVQISHWTTPAAEPKRFYTWFFLALAQGSGDVEVDGGEIHDHQWLAVRDAVKMHEAGELPMFPPTVMTLRSLLGYMTAEDAMAGIAARDSFKVLPVFATSTDSLQVMFEGDAGYESGDCEAEGPRHRARMDGASWTYIREGVPESQPRLDS